MTPWEAAAVFLGVGALAECIFSALEPKPPGHPTRYRVHYIIWTVARIAVQLALGAVVIAIACRGAP